MSKQHLLARVKLFDSGSTELLTLKNDVLTSVNTTRKSATPILSSCIGQLVWKLTLQSNNHVSTSYCHKKILVGMSSERN